MQKINELREAKNSEILANRKNQSLMHYALEKNLIDEKKKKIAPIGKKLNDSTISIPLLQKSNSGKILENPLRFYKNHVKSLSPDALETSEKNLFKENKKLSLKIDVKNKKVLQKPRHFSILNSFESEKCLLEKIINIEKLHGNELEKNKIKDYLNLFDEVCENLGQFGEVLKKIKNVFEQVYFKSLNLMNEIESLKQKLQNFELGIDEDNRTMIKKLKIVKKSEDELNFLHSQVKYKKVGKKIKSNTLINEELMGLKTLDCDSKENKEITFIEKIDATDKMDLKKIPKLLIGEQIEKKIVSNEIIGFHDEFMSNINNFSESWRRLIDKDKKY